jgi:hypothetical protein
MASEPLDRVKFDRFVAVVRRAWGADTSVDSAWDPQNPARGQCAVTALLVQDWLGGELVRAVIGDQSHYWNCVDGKVVDFTPHESTSSEFASLDPTSIELRSRNYVLSFPDTARRYGILKSRVATILREEEAARRPQANEGPLAVIPSSQRIR